MSSQRPIRVIAIVLWIIIPAVVGWLGHRRDAELRALASRGRVTEGHVTGLGRAGGKGIVYYEYVADGIRYEWNAGDDLVPSTPGVTFPVTYLPEDPQRNWVGPPLTEEVIRAETAVIRWAVPGAYALFVALLVFDAWGRRRRNAGQPITYLAGGRLVAVVIYGVIVAALCTADSRAFNETAFGPRPLGMPPTAFAVALVTLLYLPVVPVFRHGAIVVRHALQDGAGGRLGMILYLLRVGRLRPELRRSQAVVVYTLFYLFVLAGAWIAYTARRGI